MASAAKIDIELDLKITPGTAKLCLDILERFINQNPELDIIGNRLPDGTTQLKFQERKEPEPLVRVKRPEEMTPEHRQEVGL